MKAGERTSKAYTYDSYGRLSQQSTSVSGSPILTESFSYYTGTGGTSGQLRQYASTYGDGSLSYTYTYDDNGNIATVSDGTNTTRYIYDSQNQLIREYNQAAGKIWTWKYDDAGNLTHHREYDYSDTGMDTPLYTMRYTYGDANWGDLLTAYNGVAITYDEIGNPLNDGTWTYTWEHGRQMASMSDGTTTWDMTYNADGLRTGRTNGSNTYTYWYNESGQLVRMKFDSLIFRIAYGASGQPISISYNGNTYYYVLNQQGDVMALLDSSGNWVVKYTYDAWGNILSTTASTEAMRLTLAKYNPLRYRGYVYDRETGLYYLQSRYYNPEICRFISSDDVDLLAATGTPLRCNLFVYCNNNPVTCVDENGYWGHIIAGAFVGMLYLSLSSSEYKRIEDKLRHELLSGKITSVTATIVNNRSIQDTLSNRDRIMGLKSSSTVYNGLDSAKNLVTSPY